MSGEAFFVCGAGDIPVNHHFHLAVCVQFPGGPAGPEEWWGQQQPAALAQCRQGMSRGFHRAGCWDMVVDTEWRMCKILTDLHPRAGRTGLGRCHRGGELTAALPADAMQEPVQTFAGILLHEAKKNLSCEGLLEGLVHLLLSRGVLPQLGAISS